MLKEVIYSGASNRSKFVMSGFPRDVEDAKSFEKTCSKISAAIMVTEDGTTVSQSAHKSQ